MPLNPSIVSRCAIIICLAWTLGCERFTPVTVDASHIEKESSGEVVLGSTGSMVLKRKPASGAAVEVGGSGDKKVKVTVLDIADRTVVLDVTHADYETERVEIEMGETRDVYLGDGAIGARVQVKDPTE